MNVGRNVITQRFQSRLIDKFGRANLDGLALNENSIYFFFASPVDQYRF